MRPRLKARGACQHAEVSRGVQGLFSESRTLHHDTGGQTNAMPTVVSETVGRRKFDLLVFLPLEKDQILVKVLCVFFF